MMTLLSRLLAFGFLLLSATALLPAAAQAHDYALGKLEIHHPWARPSSGKTGAAYFIVRNNGASDDALIGIACGKAEKTQLHEMIMDGTIMRMRAVERLAIPAGKTVSIEPGGLHVMLVGLKGPLKDGESFPMTLTFEKAGSIDVSVIVQTPEEMRAGEAKPGHDMPATEQMPGMNDMH